MGLVYIKHVLCGDSRNNTPLTLRLHVGEEAFVETLFSDERKYHTYGSVNTSTSIPQD